MTEIERRLILRIGRLIRGDWSGNNFDGRDVQELLHLVIEGSFDEAAKRLSGLEEYYTDP